MFLVIGITGQTGAATASALLDAGHAVRALVRDTGRARDWAARGVELSQGEANDPDALAQALNGVAGAYVMVPPAPHHPDPIAWYEDVAQAVRTAARRAGLTRLVLLSSEAAHLPDGTGPIRGLHRAEQILADAAPEVVVLRPSYFQENWRALLPFAQSQNILPSMISDLSRAREMVATADIGRAAAGLLTAAAPPRLVELAGPADYAPNDAAAAIAEAIGTPVAAVAPPRQTWLEILLGAGLGQPFAELLVELYDGINNGRVRFSGDVPLQRGRTTLRENVASWVETEALTPA